MLGLAGAGIERATGWRPAEPLNGQRCMTRAAFEAAIPLADGWGVETGLTIDLLRKGMRIAEVQVPLAHRSTGTDLASQLHRAHQFAISDVARNELDISGDPFQVLPPAVDEIVHSENRLALPGQLAHQLGADESCSTRNYDLSVSPLGCHFDPHRTAVANGSRTKSTNFSMSL